MKVQCDVCENNIAEVMCCADEAALCGECDRRVHAANKLASKHQRVALLPSGAETTVCDICQEKAAFFFCMEDRAILCRNCDVAIHLPNTLSASHRRFLLTGIRVSLNAVVDPPEAPSLEDSQLTTTSKSSPNSLPNAASTSISSQLPNSLQTGFSVLPQKTVASTSNAFQSQSLGSFGSARTAQTFTESRSSLAGVGNAYSNKDGFTDFFGIEPSDWKVDELLNIPELADGYSLADVGSSKAETNNLGDFDWTADLSLFDEQVYAESLHEVPQMPSSFLASSSRGKSNQGPNKNSRSYQDLSALVPDFDDAFVPDLALDPIAKKRRL